MYASAAYHEDEQAAKGVKTYGDRYTGALRTARSRLIYLQAVLGQFGGLRLIDIGTAHMAFVDAAGDAGFSASGIDPHPLRGDCMQGTWQDVEGKWDVACLFDVLEHLTRPRKCLEHLRNCLTPEGVLIVEMPEYQGLGNWQKHIKPREHLCLYSRAAAEQLYEEEGYTVLEFHRPCRGELGKMSHILTRRD